MQRVISCTMWEDWTPLKSTKRKRDALADTSIPSLLNASILSLMHYQLYSKFNYTLSPLLFASQLYSLLSTLSSPPVNSTLRPSNPSSLFSCSSHNSILSLSPLHLSSQCFFLTCKALSLSCFSCASVLAFDNSLSCSLTLPAVALRNSSSSDTLDIYMWTDKSR